MTRFFNQERRRLVPGERIGKYLKYAVGEIILVVIGILIALQVNNWNNERKDAIKEEYYLNSISSSIELSQNELNRVISDAEMVYTSADTALFLITSDVKIDLDVVDLDSLLYNAVEYSEISLNDGGIREIINTGNLNMIGDERIRLILASWEERLHKIRKFEGDTQYTARRFAEYLFDYYDMSRTIRNPSNSALIPEKTDELFSDPRLGNFLTRVSGKARLMHHIYSQEKMLLDSLNSMVHQHEL